MINDDFFESDSNPNTIFDLSNFEGGLCVVGEDGLGQGNFIIFIIRCILNNICIIILDLNRGTKSIIHPYLTLLESNLLMICFWSAISIIYYDLGNYGI